MSYSHSRKAALILKRFVHSKRLAEKWAKIGYKIVAMSQFGNTGSFTFLLEKAL